MFPQAFNAKALRFGRAVLTKLLGCPEREDWKKCQLSKDEEGKITQKFKLSFEAFDPAASDESDSSSSSGDDD